MNELMFLTNDWVAFLILLYILFMYLKLLVYTRFKKKNSDSPFERGITSNKSSRKPYSLSFFMITLIFLLFDIEIILLTPFAIVTMPRIIVEI